MIRLSAFHVLVGMLGSGSLELEKKAAASIDDMMNFAQSKSNFRNLISSLDTAGFPPLVALLESSSVEAQEKAVHALHHLANEDSGSHKAKLIAAGALSALNRLSNMSSTAKVYASSTLKILRCYFLHSMLSHSCMSVLIQRESAESAAFQTSSEKESSFSDASCIPSCLPSPCPALNEIRLQFGQNSAVTRSHDYLWLVPCNTLALTSCLQSASSFNCGSGAGPTSSSAP